MKVISCDEVKACVAKDPQVQTLVARSGEATLLWSDRDRADVLELIDKYGATSAGANAKTYGMGLAVQYPSGDMRFIATTPESIADGGLLSQKVRCVGKKDVPAEPVTFRGKAWEVRTTLA